MKKQVMVTQYTNVEVTVNPKKFTNEFMEEFKKCFYPDINTIDKHIEHLAQLFARGLYTNGDFIEGYGPTEEMGIKFRKDYEDVETEVGGA